MFNDEQFRVVFEAVPNGMMVTDHEGVIVFVNSQIEQMFGYSRDELIGRSVETLIPERFRAAHPGLRGHFAKTPQMLLVLVLPSVLNLLLVEEIPPQKLLKDTQYGH